MIVFDSNFIVVVLVLRLRKFPCIIVIIKIHIFVLLGLSQRLHYILNFLEIVARVRLLNTDFSSCLTQLFASAWNSPTGLLDLSPIPFGMQCECNQVKVLAHSWRSWLVPKYSSMKRLALCLRSTAPSPTLHDPTSAALQIGQPLSRFAAHRAATAKPRAAKSWKASAYHAEFLWTSLCAKSTFPTKPFIGSLSFLEAEKSTSMPRGGIHSFSPPQPYRIC